MARSIHVDVFQCRGKPHDVGHALARSCLSLRGKRALRSYGSLRVAKGRFENARRTLQTFAPNLWDELEGIAKGLDLPVERAVIAYGNGKLDYPQHGCSAVVTREVYGRNYDYSPRRYDRILVAAQATGVYASIGFAHRYAGRLDGMNEKGLSVGLHYVNHEIWEPGLTSPLIVRILLDQCASTAEAVDLLQRLPHGLAFNYSILDQAGEAAVVEAVPGRVEVRRGSQLVCTNHFQSRALQGKNPETIEHTKRRTIPLVKWARGGLTSAELFSTLNDPRSPAFHHGYARGFGTLHTIVCQPAKRVLTIGVGAAADPLVVDVGAWARGGSLGLDKLSGKLGAHGQNDFFGRDLAHSHFRDVNLESAQFDDINFANAEISENCNFEGMRIGGVLLADLFAAYKAQNA